jgi:hypothetical protein
MYVEHTYDSLIHGQKVYLLVITQDLFLVLISGDNYIFYLINNHEM